MSLHQKILLRLPAGRIGALADRYLRGRTWTIEAGEGAGLKLMLPQNRDYVTGRSEIPVQRALAACLRPGGVCYDVGANVGFFALQAARRVGAAGLVCAFEPVPANATALRRNAGINGMSQMRVFEVAAGQSDGIADFLVPAWDGGGSLATSVNPPAGGSRIAVRTIRLDDFVTAERLPLPDVVKIDVEGCELEVLAGMARIIDTRMPALLYEVDDPDEARFQERWRQIDDYCTKLGYQVSRLESSYANIHWFVGHSLATRPGAR